MKLTGRDRELLRELLAARWLTTSQIHRRFFPHTTPDAVRKRLRKLVAADYLFRYQRDRMQEAMFTLGREGRRVLEQHGTH